MLPSDFLFVLTLRYSLKHLSTLCPFTWSLLFEYDGFPSQHCSYQAPLLLMTSGDFASGTKKIHASFSSGPDTQCSYHPLFSKVNPLPIIAILLAVPKGDTGLCSYYFCHQDCLLCPFCPFQYYISFNSQLEFTSSKSFLPSIL